MVRAKTQKAAKGTKAAANKSAKPATAGVAAKAGPKKQSQTEHPRLIGAPLLFARSLKLLWRHWKLFGVLLLVYIIAYAILVGGFSGTSLPAIKQTLHQTGGNSNQLSNGVTLFSALITASGNTSNPTAGVYQTLLLLIISLVLIWALRQIHAEQPIRARDAFYKGTYPLIPFLLVLLIIGLQLLPMAAGVAIYSLMIGSGIAVGVVEGGIALAILLLGAAISIYMLCSSIFALYIVTLPNMTPLRALKSARGLVKHRRWVVLRKLLFLPLVLILLGAIILIPASLYLTTMAALLLFGLTILAVAVAHSYMYELYRELL